MKTRYFCKVCESEANDECIAIGHTIVGQEWVEEGDDCRWEGIDGPIDYLWDIYIRNKDLTAFLRKNAPRPDMPEKVIECMIMQIPDGQDHVDIKGIRYTREALENMIHELNTMRNTLALYAEVAEYNDETPFKWWGRGAWETQKDKAAEELIDVLHFLMIAFEDLGIDANEIHRLYCNKNRRNWQRFKEKLGWKVPQR